MNVRRTHPGLYHSIMTVAVAQLALGVNFWLYTPAFSPYGISKYVVAVVFAALGAAQITFLSLVRNLARVRVTLAVSIWVTFWWGIANTQQVINGGASWQLPIFILAVCVLQVPLVVEAPVNPATKTKA